MDGIVVVALWWLRRLLGCRPPLMWRVFSYAAFWSPKSSLLRPLSLILAVTPRSVPTLRWPVGRDRVRGSSGAVFFRIVFSISLSGLVQKGSPLASWSFHLAIPQGGKCGSSDSRAKSRNGRRPGEKCTAFAVAHILSTPFWFLCGICFCAVDHGLFPSLREMWRRPGGVGAAWASA